MRPNDTYKASISESESPVTSRIASKDETLNRMPFKARKSVFEKLEKIVDIASLSKEERMKYDESIKVYRDRSERTMSVRSLWGISSSRKFIKKTP